MIRVTRLNHSGVVLNSDLIEQIESTPDTVISLTNGERIMVLESPDEVIAAIVSFRRSILNPSSLGMPLPGSGPQTSPGEPHG
jgi:flagellar protein FlbD